MKLNSSLLANSIISYLKSNELGSSKAIHDGLSGDFSYATLKRMLQQLVQEGMVETIGQGKGTKYKISKTYGLIFPIDTEEYFQKEIDERIIKNQFDHSLIRETLANARIFTNGELDQLNRLQDQFLSKISKLSAQSYKKEMERLAIDLSWKSSQIEGNTYSLLETERLLNEKQTASGKTKDEAVMLLNHKAAIDFILEHPDYVQPLRVSVIEDIHSILIKDLNVERNIRNRNIGITGTNYKPLDNEFQIREALEEVCKVVNNNKNVFARALLVLLLISYIQPFADGNKRTARIVSNAILINNNFCPLSFRTVDAMDYKKAMLIFYEVNNISAVKNIFIEQFEFAVDTYF